MHYKAFLTGYTRDNKKMGIYKKAQLPKAYSMRKASSIDKEFASSLNGSFINSYRKFTISKSECIDPPNSQNNDRESRQVRGLLFCGA